MSPDAAAWLANVRAEAAAPGALLVVVRDRSRSVAIFPEDIVGKSDDELQAFIAKRLTEQ
jgi:hypothetical protein